MKDNLRYKITIKSISLYTSYISQTQHFYISTVSYTTCIDLFKVTHGIFMRVFERLDIDLVR